ncbi:hypothetical protein NO932_18050 [Pelagibacterium sp. 26DY04]|uniref:hypothetical protein n=1 Tax=Pelagibacterium sp. 26DY04 TaxID=2967130 RepID=UPI002815C608|nr:hypothetical protein [Pelagibacterium sp. 26DY04]WMT86779.1 hypothetical protein NO932_18050 [Pelagibacterium sp. 26DY04]
MSTSEVSALSPHAFRERFPEITVGFNWPRFEAESWPVTRLTLTDPTALSRYHTFFRYSLGRINGHFLHWLAMRQMRVDEVLAKLARVPEPHRSSIIHFADLYRSGPAPIRLEIPSFALPDGGQYIMDFNHRVCGLALSGMALELDVFSIVGPVSKDVLKDATHCRPRP